MKILGKIVATFIVTGVMSGCGIFVNDDMRVPLVYTTHAIPRGTTLKADDVEGGWQGSGPHYPFCCDEVLHAKFAVGKVTRVDLPVRRGISLQDLILKEDSGAHEPELQDDAYQCVVMAAKDLKAGEALKPEDVTQLFVHDGIAPADVLATVRDCNGAKLNRSLKKGSALLKFELGEGAKRLPEKAMGKAAVYTKLVPENHMILPDGFKPAAVDPKTMPEEYWLIPSECAGRIVVHSANKDQVIINRDAVLISERLLSYMNEQWDKQAREREQRERREKR